MNNLLKITLGLVSLTVLVSSLWLKFANEGANKLIDEANAALNQANAFTEKASEAYSQLFTEENLAGFPSNREQLKPMASNLSESMGKAADTYAKASELFVASSKKGVRKAVADYWELKAQQLGRLAESKRAFQTIAQSVQDESIESLDAWNAKTEDLFVQAKRLNAEAAELEKKADALMAENKELFQ